MSKQSYAERRAQQMREQVAMQERNDLADEAAMVVTTEQQPISPPLQIEGETASDYRDVLLAEYRHALSLQMYIIGLLEEKFNGAPRKA